MLKDLRIHNEYCNEGMGDQREGGSPHNPNTDMPNKRHADKRQFNVPLPTSLVEKIDDYATEKGWTRAQVVARLLGQDLGADKEEIDRIMKLNEQEG